MTTEGFSCACGKISGEVSNPPSSGLHLMCYCGSCRAAANHCGAGLSEGTPVDLFLTPPHNVSVSQGVDQLAPFAFSPRGVVRWQASCCGVQMFSSQPNPKIAFMSVSAARFEKPEVLGPVQTKSFVPKGDGKAAQEGKLGLAKLIFMALGARITGKWRKSPLYEAASMLPIAKPTLISKEDKQALLQ